MLIALAALAGEASAAENAAAGDRPGRALFEQAEAKFNVGRFDEALVDYQAAYDAEPLPAFLFNIGQCHRNLGNYERAQFFFRRYTALEPNSPNRPAAERLIAEMDRLAGEQASSGAPDQPAPPLPPVAPPPAALVAAPSPAAEAPSRPIYRRTEFWVAVSAVAVAVGIAAAVAYAHDDPRSSLRPIDTR
jgi:tetratricopeptide (TPR) repeat protein